MSFKVPLNFNHSMTLWLAQSNSQNKKGLCSVLDAWVQWEYTQMGENVFEEDIGKPSSNWKREQRKCMCIFFLVPFQMLLSSQERRRLCRILHAELLNEFLLMKVAGNEAATDSYPQLWSVIVPRARQLLPPAARWKGSSACIFKEDFDWSEIEQLQNCSIFSFLLRVKWEGTWFSSSCWKDKEKLRVSQLAAAQSCFEKTY